MALIKCIECGHMVSDKASKCPSCGCPTSHEHQNRCVECGTLVDNHQAVCPNCGCPVNSGTILPPKEDSFFATGHNALKKNSSNSILKAIVAVLIIIMLGVSFAIYKSHTNGNGSSDLLGAIISQTEEKQKEPEKSIEERIREVASVDEAHALLNGTTWHYTENLSTSKVGGWIKVVFNNGTYTTYYAQPSDGHWTEGGTGSYKIHEGRYSNTGEKYISVQWEGDMKIEYLTIPCQFSMTLDTFQLNVGSTLIDGMANMTDRMEGRSYYYSASRGKTNLVGQMEFGDYEWN